MAITLRLTKGSELTYAELDGNFTDLDARLNFLPDSGRVSRIILDDVDSAYVQARQVDFYRDSSFVTGIVDAAYVNSLATANLDSAEVVQLIDSAYVTNRLDLSTISQDLIPSADSTYNLGDSTHRWKDLYLSGNTLHLGGIIMSADSAGLVINQPLQAEVRMDGNLDMKDNIITSTTGNIQIMPKTNWAFENYRTEFLNLHGDGGYLPTMVVGGGATGTPFGVNPTPHVYIGDSALAAANYVYANGIPMLHLSRIPDMGKQNVGAMYYNTTANTFYFQESDGWQTYVSLNTLQTAAASADSFGSFKTLIAAL